MGELREKLLMSLSSTVSLKIGSTYPAPKSHSTIGVCTLLPEFQHVVELIKLHEKRYTGFGPRLYGVGETAPRVTVPRLRLEASSYTVIAVLDPIKVFRAVVAHGHEQDAHLYDFFRHATSGRGMAQNSGSPGETLDEHILRMTPKDVWALFHQVNAPHPTFPLYFPAQILKSLTELVSVLTITDTGEFKAWVPCEFLSIIVNPVRVYPF